VDLNKVPSGGRDVQVGATTMSGRTQELLNLGVNVIVCGALSDPFFRLLKEEGIWTICGIAGEVEVVVAAFLEGTLARPCFLMPGADQSLAPMEQNES
jgi:predicted Fe-Mo cluster-binding NifX family protein